jgi:hypothetical protein
MINQLCARHFRAAQSRSSSPTSRARRSYELGQDSYADVLEAHRRDIRRACARYKSAEVDTQGDAFFFAFETAPAALAAAAELTEALSSGPVRARAGVHTGLLFSRTGTTSASTSIALRASPLPVTAVRYSSRSRPPHFPPIRSVRGISLPVAAWPLLGPEAELAAIRALVQGDVRLVTLTGAGGSGKTRLALQAAADVSERFRDGTFFVPLAPIREAEAVYAAVAEAVGLRADDNIVGWLTAKDVLLVLDNPSRHPEQSTATRTRPSAIA